MSYQVFARKYRPRTFDDVLGQDHVVTTLRNAIEGERLAHAYLFVGPAGVGKREAAGIFAGELFAAADPAGAERHRRLAADLLHPMFKIGYRAALRARFIRNYWVLYLVMLAGWMLKVLH